MKTTEKTTAKTLKRRSITYIAIGVISIIIFVPLEAKLYLKLQPESATIFLLAMFLPAAIFITFFVLSLLASLKADRYKFYEQEKAFFNNTVPIPPFPWIIGATDWPKAWKKELDDLQAAYENGREENENEREALLEIAQMKGDSREYKQAKDDHRGKYDDLTTIVTHAERLPEVVASRRRSALEQLNGASRKAQEFKRTLAILAKKGPRFDFSFENEALDMTWAELGNFKKRFRVGDVETPHDLLAYLDPRSNIGGYIVLQGVKDRIELVRHRLFLLEEGLVKAELRLMTVRNDWEHTFRQKYDDLKEWLGKDPVAKEEPLLSPEEIADKLQKAKRLIYLSYEGEPGSKAEYLGPRQVIERKTAYEMAIELIDEVERNNERIDVLPKPENDKNKTT